MVLVSVSGFGKSDLSADSGDPKYHLHTYCLYTSPCLFAAMCWHASECTTFDFNLLHDMQPFALGQLQDRDVCKTSALLHLETGHHSPNSTNAGYSKHSQIFFVAMSVVSTFLHTFMNIAE